MYVKQFSIVYLLHIFSKSMCSWCVQIKSTWKLDKCRFCTMQKYDFENIPYL
jgi:hypothetical protein